MTTINDFLDAHPELEGMTPKEIESLMEEMEARMEATVDANEYGGE